MVGKRILLRVIFYLMNAQIGVAGAELWGKYR